MADIRLEKHEAVARLTLERPEKLNALSPALLRELVATCEAVAGDDSAKVVILEGSGDHFSSGADLPVFSTELIASPHAVADLGRIAARAVADLPQLTIAAIRGHCIGGALVLAAMCDLRIAATNALFRIPELEVGIPLAWGGMDRLCRLIGETQATDLVVTCRPFDAVEAQRLGLLSRVVDAGELATESERLAAAIAAKPRGGLLATKRQLQAIRKGTFDPLRDADALLAAISDPETAAAINAYTDRLT